MGVGLRVQAGVLEAGVGYEVRVGWWTAEELVRTNPKHLCKRTGQKDTKTNERQYCQNKSATDSREDQSLKRCSGPFCKAGGVLVSSASFAQLGLQASLEPSSMRIRREKLSGLSLPIMSSNESPSQFTLAFLLKFLFCLNKMSYEERNGKKNYLVPAF